MLDLAKLNPQQQQAVKTVDGPLLILAGAGTGKTRVIAYRVGHLIERGVSPRNILAVTFTNKAAREMRERVGKLLGAEKAKGLTISTFHALCVRILREDIVALGYTPNFTIYDESDQLGVVRKIVGESVSKDEKADPKVMLALISKAKSSGVYEGFVPRHFPLPSPAAAGKPLSRREEQIRQDQRPRPSSRRVGWPPSSPLPSNRIRPDQTLAVGGGRGAFVHHRDRRTRVMTNLSVTYWSGTTTRCATPTRSTSTICCCWR